MIYNMNTGEHEHAGIHHIVRIPKERKRSGQGGILHLVHIPKIREKSGQENTSCSRYSKRKGISRAGSSGDNNTIGKRGLVLNQ